MIAARRLTITRASPGDEAFLRELYVDTRQAEYATLGWPTVALEALLHGEYAARRRHHAVEYPNAEQLLIRADGAAVGQLYVDRSGESIRLVDMSLRSTHRGQGIGTELIEVLKAEALARRVPLRLCVRSGNPAERLYVRLGFRERGSGGIDRQFEWRAAATVTG